jgi:hypothetical protein
LDQGADANPHHRLDAALGLVGQDLGHPLGSRQPGEYLASLGVDAGQPWGTVEADFFQVPQEGMNVVGSLMQRPVHRLADPDDAVGLATTGKGLLGQLVHEPSLGSTEDTAKHAQPKI